MSSPNIKFQSVMRNFKNGAKETLDKKKIIKDFTYDLKIDEVVDATELFISVDKDSFCYTFGDPLGDPPGDPLDAAPTVFATFLEPAREIPQLDIREYIGDGYLKNVYNAELCDKDWVALLYFINRIYPNFCTLDRVRIKSLHVGAAPEGELSAMHHFLYNSEVSRDINIEWEWLGPNRTQLRHKYKHNLVALFNSAFSSPDNINFLMNETMGKLGRANLLCAELPDSSPRDAVACGLIALKAMETNSIAYIKLPSVDLWDARTVNAVLMFGLIFVELYVFKLDLGGGSAVLICKNKKRAVGDSVAKKLTYLLNNRDFADECNIFSSGYLDSDAIRPWIDRVKKIIQDERAASVLNVPAPMTFDDMMYEISKVLGMNLDTFL
jgi:hypothetical protein